MVAPGEYSFRLQKGMSGGFAPPNPSAIVTMTKPSNVSFLNIAAATREPDAPSLQDLAPKSIDTSKQHTTELINELHDILHSIPTESPPASEDIYGLDTSIAWGSDDLQWMNLGPQGCVRGESSVQPTPEQKIKFKRAVDIVHELLGKNE
ncbi:hypothetical protein K443DRAFT_94570 [Laccaria amethystina LaAM-08-1]|uniref:Uncharacterized protein n=1 Tax=Laccaria amethystina LaAM-08-1 TaxID=1095629 RepID=A0A0C9Y133_9AGAR|nr:hypothetical protein K443DRAFT_94570 [Laccaria amethystina LaAM-08-1]